MNVHEYQAKSLFAQAGIPVPKGILAETADDAAAAYTELGGELAVVKTQIHAGGRGAGHFAGAATDKGGVALVRSADEARAEAHRMLGNRLVTKQTGAEGVEVRKVYIEEGSAIKRELYLGMTLDRATGYPTLMASTEGGMDIEEVAEKTPHLIHTATVTDPRGLQAHQARSLFFRLFASDSERDAKGNERPLLTKKSLRSFCDVVIKLSKLYLESDCSLAEINPLVVKDDDSIIALDGKLNFDESALYRQPEIKALFDPHEENPAELRAAEHNLSYVALDGTIGCMVNGAGLAMATMDIIDHYGAEPANFLDVGGGATAERVTEAFRIITSDPKVKAILINIFGGIVKCDLIADGVIEAVKQTGLEVPLVVRLEGTNVEAGRKKLAESGLNLVAAEGLAAAAKKVVELAGGAQ